MSAILTVNIVTYNHEKYIEQCIRSVFNQVVSFEFMVQVTDDFSTDSTPILLNRLKEEFGNRLMVITNSENKGMVKNITDSLYSCKTEYVAILEGDDFFIDREKLQRQIEVLRADNTLSFCFTNGSKILLDEQKPFYTDEFYHKQRFDLEEFLEGNYSILNTSKVFRRDSLPEKMPKWYYEVHLWDWIMHILQLQSGDAIYLEINGTGFRQHDESYIKRLDRIENYKNGLFTVKALDKQLNWKYHYILGNDSQLKSLISIEYFKNKQYLHWASYFLQSIFRDPKRFISKFRDYIWKLRH